MNNDTTIQSTNRSKIHPQLFLLFVAMASILMMFAGWTSAYIVKNAAGNWLEFPMPKMFYVSTTILVISGIFLHLSFIGYKKQKESWYKWGLVTAFILGILFIVFQYLGWREMFGMGVELNGNVAGSFTYLLTGMHAFHVLGGIAAIIVAMIHAFSLKFVYKEHRKNRFEVVLYYWHFVDLLWIYLLLFMINAKM